MRRILLLTCALLFAIGSPINLLMATDYFVSQTGSNGNTGLGTGDGEAFRTITHAITVATTPGDTITLLAGTWDNADDGETFPIVVPDGITIQGSGSAFTTVNGEGGVPFRINGGTNTTILSDMTIQSTGSGFVVRAQESPDDLRISSCVISGGAIGFAHIDNPGSETGDLDDLMGIQLLNNQFVNQLSSNALIFANNPVASTGTANITISGNTATPGTSATSPICFGITMWAGSHQANIAVNSNSCIGGAEGIGMFLRGTTNFDFGGSVSVNGNDCISQSSAGIGIEFVARGGQTMAFLLDVSNNAVSSLSGQEAIGVSAFARNSAILTVGNLNCGVMSNIVPGNTGHGIVLMNTGINDGAVTNNLNVQYNCIESNTGIGLYVRGVASGSGAVAMNGDVLNNVINGQGASGVRVGFTATSNATVDGTLNFGVSTANPGWNTIRNNAAVTGFNFYCGIPDTVSSNNSLLAQCNWWGTDDLTAIAAGIWDDADSSGLAPLTFAPIAANSLAGFTANVSEWSAVGDPVIITAAINTWFLGSVGEKNIAVTMGGLPVDNLVVFGPTLSFTVPLGITLDDALIVITNPGGQTGSLLLAFDGGIIVLPPGFFDDDGGGLCFVATAAFGDDDAPEVLVLRKWRDEHLNKHALGRAFVRTYYALSPSLAESISDSDSARTVTRAALAPLVGAVRLWIEAPWLVMLGGGMLAFSMLRRRR